MNHRKAILVDRGELPVDIDTEVIHYKQHLRPLVNQEVRP